MSARRKVLREVAPELRASRGRWWRPNGNGYTDDIAEAGLFDAGTYRGDRDSEVDATTALSAEMGKFERLSSMLAEAKPTVTTLLAEVESLTAERDALLADRPKILAYCESVRDDLLGGHHDPEALEIFRHGMATICNALQQRLGRTP